MRVNIKLEKTPVICVLQSSVLDFGKIIIYTSNLRIIKAPARTPEMPRHRPVSPADLQGSPKAKEPGSRRRSQSKGGGERLLGDMEKEVMGLVLVLWRRFASNSSSSSYSLREKLQDGECGHVVVICKSSLRGSYSLPLLPQPPPPHS